MTTDFDTIPAVQPFIQVAMEVAQEKGDYVLFALVEHEIYPGIWHLVVSADWIKETDIPTVQYFVDKLRHYVPRDSPIKVNAVIVLTPTDRFVKDIMPWIPPRDKRPLVWNHPVRGVGVSEAYIITVAH
jgi:hypothetical protein